MYCVSRHRLSGTGKVTQSIQRQNTLLPKEPIDFLVGIWSWLADKLSFHPYEAVFYKLTVPKVHPPFCRITAYATMPG
jgi:hypothetical protein